MFLIFETIITANDSATLKAELPNGMSTISIWGNSPLLGV